MEDISTVPVIDEELFLIVPKKHRFANKNEVQLMELADDSFVLYKQESGLQDVIKRLCEEAGFQPKMSFEGVGDSTIAGFVAANFGVALIPSIPGLDMKKISLLRVSEPECRRVIQLAWRTNGYMSPAVERFKGFAEKFSF